MAKSSGIGDRLLVGGYDLSGDTGSIQRISGGPAALDLTDIGQGAFDREGGLRTGAIDFTSWFNKAAGRAHPVLKALPRVDTLVTYCHGYTLGAPCASCVALQVGYDPTRGADGSLSMAVQSVSNGYGVEWGFQLTPGLRTDTSASNGASVDGTASSSLGAQFYLQSTALTGTSCTVAIEDSANDSAWAALSGAAFTAFTGPGWQRVAVAGTVRRYLRAVTTGTFSSASFLVQAVRNEVAVAF